MASQSTHAQLAAIKVLLEHLDGQVKDIAAAVKKDKGKK